MIMYVIQCFPNFFEPRHTKPKLEIRNENFDNLKKENFDSFRDTVNFLGDTQFEEL
jgi:hypothetical protein